MSKNRFLILLIVLHLTFLVIALITGGSYIPDSYDYLFQAQNLRDFGSFYAFDVNQELKPDYYTKRTPAYAVFLLLTGSIPWLVLLIQNVLSVLVWFLVYKLLLNKGVAEKAAGYVVLAVLLVKSNVLIYANSIMAEIPFQLMVLLGFYCLQKDIDRPNDRNWWLASLFFSVGLLFKPVLLYFWLPFLFMAIIRAYQLKRIRLIYSVVLIPLTLFLWSVYNQKVTGYAHFTSISTVNLKDYNTRLMLESAYGVDYADSVIEGINQKAETFPDYGRRNQFIQDTCSQIISENITDYAKVHFKGMLAMLLDPGRFDYVQFFRFEQGEDGLMYKLARGDFRGMFETLKAQPVPIIFFFVINLLGSIFLFVMTLLGLWKLRSQPMLLVLLLVIISYFWVLTGPVGTARYKSVLLPFMVFISGLNFSFRFGKTR